ncbi:hypothetical protein LTR56_025553 [Elasticomyces elasticus]|nr:hypothetical protein LTR56_025553 [Elasticomyces elasticus]
MARYDIEATGRHVPEEDDPERWVIQRRLLQHADRCTHHVKRGSVVEAGIDWFVQGIGDLYADQCKLAQAEEIYTRALEGYEKELGADHTSTLDTVNNLGSVYLRQGKRAEAEEMYMRALEGLAATL